MGKAKQTIKTSRTTTKKTTIILGKGAKKKGTKRCPTCGKFM